MRGGAIPRSIGSGRDPFSLRNICAARNSQTGRRRIGNQNNQNPHRGTKRRESKELYTSSRSRKERHHKSRRSSYSSSSNIPNLGNSQEHSRKFPRADSRKSRNYSSDISEQVGDEEKHIPIRRSRDVKSNTSKRSRQLQAAAVSDMNVSSKTRAKISVDRMDIPILKDATKRRKKTNPWEFQPTNTLVTRAVAKKSSLESLKLSRPISRPLPLTTKGNIDRLTEDKKVEGSSTDGIPEDTKEKTRKIGIPRTRNRLISLKGLKRPLTTVRKKDKDIPVSPFNISSSSSQPARKHQRRDTAPSHDPPYRTGAIDRRRRSSRRTTTKKEKQTISLLSSDEEKEIKPAKQMPRRNPPRTTRAVRNKPPPNMELVGKYPPGEPDSVTIFMSDMERLQPGQMLNDSIIDFYLKYVLREKCENGDNFYAFSSFFFTKIRKAKTSTFPEFYNSVRRWTKNVNIFEKHYLLVPINEYEHWTLAVICHPDRLFNKLEDNVFERTVLEESKKGAPCILYFDSLKGGNKFGRQLKLLRTYLTLAFREKMEERLKEKSEFSEKYQDIVKNMKVEAHKLPARRVEVPQQSNDTDCGVYLLHFAELFCRKPFQDLQNTKHKQWFEESDILEKRTKMEQILVNLREERDKRDLKKNVEKRQVDPQIVESIKDIVISTVDKVMEKCEAENIEIPIATVENIPEFPELENQLPAPQLSGKTLLPSVSDSNSKSSRKYEIIDDIDEIPSSLPREVENFPGKTRKISENEERIKPIGVINLLIDIDEERGENLLQQDGEKTPKFHSDQEDAIEEYDEAKNQGLSSEPETNTRVCGVVSPDNDVDGHVDGHVEVSDEDGVYSD
ncbi:hypothetical protein AAMO2058_001440000 [Amorphochlora amoebiformis]